MTGPSRRAVLLSSLGFATAAGTAVLPALAQPAGVATIDLDAMLPTRFGGWTVAPDARPILPDEVQERGIADAYDGWRARVYRRGDGAVVMLVVAYGSSTSRTLAVHRPETCYAAQGFAVSRTTERALPDPFGGLIAREMIATRDDRVEPVLFWMTVAGRQSGFGIAQNLALLRAAWRGEAPDAFLIRISTIRPDGIGLARSFAAAFLAASTPSTRRHLGAS